MYLGCVSSLSSFRSSLDFLRFFEVAQKLGQSPCTIVQGFCQILQKMKSREFSIFIFFLIHIHVLRLCFKFELIPIKFRFFTIF